MISKRKIFSLLCLIFLICSCKKENINYPIHGRVTDESTHSGILNATVNLQTFDPTCYNYYCNDSGIIIQSTVTDANGNFEFPSFYLEHGKAYRLVANANEHSTDSYWNVIKFDPEDHADEMNFTLYPEAWLKIHVKNTNPINANDHLQFISYNFYGMNVDTTFLFGAVGGNRNQSLGWYVTKNNIFSNHDTLIYCPSFDTTVCNINY